MWTFHSLTEKLLKKPANLTPSGATRLWHHQQRSRVRAHRKQTEVRASLLPLFSSQRPAHASQHPLCSSSSPTCPSVLLTSLQTAGSLLSVCVCVCLIKLHGCSSRLVSSFRAHQPLAVQTQPLKIPHGTSTSLTAGAPLQRGER